MRKRALLTTAGVLVGMVIAGCSDKPPECAAPQALAVAQSVMVDGFTDTVGQMYSDPHNVHEPADVAKVRAEISTYAKGLKVTITNVVQDGYDSGARKFTCSGKLTITTSTGKTFSRETSYGIQSTADGKNSFVVQVSQPAAFIEALEQDFTRMFYDKGIQFRLRQASTSGQPPQAACVEAKMVAAKRELDARLDKDMRDAEAKGDLFKGLSPVQEEEWQEKSMQKAKQECGA